MLTRTRSRFGPLPRFVDAGRAGLSLVEILLGMVVLVVAVLGTMSSITSSAILGESTREVTVATLAAQRMVETLHGLPAETVFAEYNDFDTDDAGGAGTAAGPSFAVAGLDPRPDDADGMVGLIIMPTAGGSGSLLEVRNDPDFGMPMDLNSDGVIDGGEHASDYRILPVRVRVEWTGSSGDRFVEIDTLLAVR